MRLRLPVLRDDTAYLGTSLFLPRRLVAEAPVQAALTFGVEAGLEPRVLVRAHPHHLEVPRNFLSVDQMSALGIDKVVDLRPTSFPPSSLRPKPNFALKDDNQRAAWRALQVAVGARRDGVLRLDTGSGKTVMGLRYACEVGGPLLVVSWQEAHLNAWEKELRTWFLLDGPVGWVAGSRMEYDREVVFSTIQTLVKRFESGELPLDFHMRFALTIFDETHHMAAEHFAKGSTLTVGLRLGLTATFARKDRCEGVVTYNIGKILYDDPSTSTLVPSVRVHATGTRIADDDPEILDVNRQPSVPKMQGKLGRLDDRNRLIVRVVEGRLDEGRKVYVISHSKDHVYELVRLLKAANRSVGVITGDEKNADERLRQLEGFDCVVATLTVGKENYNRPALSALVLTTPLAVDPHAPTEFVQVVGRVLRPLAGKPDPVVDLFADHDVSQSFGMLLTVLRWCRSRGWAVEDDAWKTTKNAKSARAWRVRR